MAKSETARRKPQRQAVKAAAAIRVDRSQYLSRAVAKSFEILELFQTRQSALALNEVAKLVKLSKTSAFRLICTLQASGYLVQHNESGSYELAPEVRSVVSSRFLIRLLKVATPLMVDLARELRETINLAALFENRVEVIAVEECSEMLRMTNVVGHILPPNASSLGKVLTAFQTSDRRERLLRSYGLYRFTDHTITDRTKLEQEFDESRKRGYAVDREESLSDAYCCAVPIFSADGEAAAGISVSLPKIRVKGAAQQEMFVKALTAVASRISRELA